MDLLFRDCATWNPTLAEHVNTNYLLMSIKHNRHAILGHLWSMSFIYSIKCAHLWHQTRLLHILEVLLGLFDGKAEVRMVVLHASKGPMVGSHDACVEHLLLASNTDNALFGSLVWGAVVISNLRLS